MDLTSGLMQLLRKTADTEGVRIEYYSIIYNLIDDIKAIMGGMLSPELSENIIGIAGVKDVFRSPKVWRYCWLYG